MTSSLGDGENSELIELVDDSTGVTLEASSPAIVLPGAAPPPPPVLTGLTEVAQAPAATEETKPPTSPPEEDIDRTRIDLGDDLIEKTAFIFGSELKGELEPESNSPVIESTVENARILLNEGFPEEAKKILRQLLLKNRSDIEAQRMLEEIHASELKVLFSNQEVSVRKSYAQPSGRVLYDESILHVDTSKVLRELDEEFDLEIDLRDQSVFKKLDLELGESTPGDRIDLAISFLEMELYAHANQLLKAVIQSGDDRAETAVSLMAQGYLMNHQPYEAISVLQPFLNDADIDVGNKTDFFYLMARALESLGRNSEALGWYLHVESQAPNYRDTPDRLKRFRGTK